MTPEQIEFHRKRFEEIAFLKRNELQVNRRSLFRKTQENVYCSTEIEDKWKGYLMAIQSIEIDIPDDDCFECSESGITILDSGIRRGTMIDSIKSIGLKVKE